MIVSALLFNTVVVTGVIKKTGYYVDIIGFSKLFGISVLLYFAVSMIENPYSGLSGIFLSLTLIGIGYFPLCFVASVFTKTEVKILKKIVKS